MFSCEMITILFSRPQGGTHTTFIILKTAKEEFKNNISWLVRYKWIVNNIMSEKHRHLPLWMVKSDVECSKDKEVEKKKSHKTSTKRTRKRRR